MQLQEESKKNMRLDFANKKQHKKHDYTPTFPCLALYAVLFIFSIVIMISDACATNTVAQVTPSIIDPSVIEFPQSINAEDTIVDLGVALQRHKSGRIKTYFQAGKAWQIGEDALSLTSNFKNGTYAAEDGIVITMLDEKGDREFWINAEKACVSIDESTTTCIGKCFGFVKLESPDIEIFGTNLLLFNTSSTNVLTIEHNATLRLKSLNPDSLEGKK